MEFLLPTFVARKDDQIAMRYIAILERDGYRTSIVPVGKKSQIDEVVLLGEEPHLLAPGWCHGAFKIAAHTIPESAIPSWVTTPFVVGVKIPLDGHVRPRHARSIAKSYNTFFKSEGKILPCGTPVRVTRTRFSYWIREVQKTLKEYPVTQGPQLTRPHHVPRS